MSAKLKTSFLLVAITFIFYSCGSSQQAKNNKLQVVTTTTMITDLLHNIGKDSIEVQGLMGPGVDPHLYKASEGDVNKLFNADIIFYNGLHLEGKLVDIFEKMSAQNKNAIAISDTIPHALLIESGEFADNYDPHIWFDTRLWNMSALYVAAKLAEADPKNKAYYLKNAKEYSNKIKSLRANLNTTVQELPVEKRILITAHDAFNYFGKEFDFNVIGLQGLSTATEAGVKDVQKLSKFIIEHKVKAIFIESSVPQRTIEALKESVASKGHEVNIGGTLYSDALGNPGTEEGTYLGMYKYNTNTIVSALK
ncbi:metal ABC transporter solute-binding protein, Zn/Mn family [Aureibacter tunicatorum]|uniref:Manganese/zinc/iron transport system substrate-binding protein n=1 Tax=Aureibacter tunicatorum TaxID=866807 RepID=A0AAE3XJJ7_9BACT|nr:zinc ABC transporter substrate-binding protein [Aureibacter tunicatorum]MDR6238911.1 manganese/zinc/iron transport system substrate-binding protein [Aureibacter tunicatorum]BDD05162.1 manganese transporter [Aureibacter tunicatorum]